MAGGGHLMVSASLIEQLGRNKAYQFEFEAHGRAQRHGLGMGTGATPWREAGVKIDQNVWRSWQWAASWCVC